jgi:hypothetical protein
MHDELAARHRAITLRFASRPVKAICAAVGRSEVWFRKGRGDPVESLLAALWPPDPSESEEV